MAKEFFKDLPDTTTPLTSSRLNGLLDGDEALGNIIVDSIKSKNMLNLDTFEKGRLDNGVIGYKDGTTSITFGNNSVNIVTNAPYRGAVSGYIKVDPRTNYVYSITRENSNLTVGCSCYDENKTFLDTATAISIKETSTSLIRRFITVANTAYVRLTLMYNVAGTTTISNLQFEKGVTATDYVPYQNLSGKEIYSINENVIGEWINGKPIYRKIVTFTPRTDALETTISHGISNIDEILATSKCLLYRNNKVFVPFSMTYPNSNTNILNWSTGWEISQNDIITWIGSNMRQQIDTSRGYGAIAILEYTKTTD